MKTQVEDLSEVKKLIHVEIPWEDVEKRIRVAVREISRHARIPGFRPGKAPESLIRNRYAQHLKEDVMNHVVPEAYREVVKEHQLDVISEPSLHDVIYTEGSPFRFQVTVETRPNVQPADYKGIQLKGEAVNVSDEEVESVLKNYQENAAELIPQQDTPAANGHFLNSKVKATIAQDGNRRTVFDDRTLIAIGSDDTHPAFTENLTEKKAGDTVEFEVSYPEDFSEKSLAGKTVHYRVEIESVNERRLAPLDDEFAKDLGDFSSLADLREKVRKDILNAKKADQRNRLKDEIMRQIIDRNAFEIPEGLVRQETEALLKSYAQTLHRRGVNLKEVDWKEPQGRFSKQADLNVRGSILLHEIAKAENLKITDEDVQAAIQRIADDHRRAPEAVKAELAKENKMDDLKDQLLVSKTLDFLLDEAKVEEVSKGEES